MTDSANNPDDLTDLPESDLPEAELPEAELLEAELLDEDAAGSESVAGSEEVVWGRVISPSTAADDFSSHADATVDVPQPVVGSAKARAVRITSLGERPAAGDGGSGQASAAENAEEVRRGSPFAPNTNRPASSLGQHQVTPMALSSAAFEQRVAAETAGGGVVAAGVILPLALVSIVWFPVGGAMIAALGALLGLIGISSRHARWATALLLLHGGVFCGAFFLFIQTN